MSEFILRVGHEVPETDAEGPGRRYAIWVQGCTLLCPGCCNPELFSAEGGTPVHVNDLLERILATDVEGISLLGGEPLQQPVALAELCRRTREAGLSVMIFSGYTIEEIRQLDGGNDVLAWTDLLVDGRYDRSQPDEVRRWIGSRNQRLHFLTDRYHENDPQFVSPDSIEIRLSGGELTINGRPWGRGLPQ